ncbi:MAG TPA: glycine cleavage T C-terminal barrel domain-containing protein [Pirellulales bacterium]|nr:glycine cleavage T C-terminal barrel domain-containing protein [Pirellulales bacterium]
MNKTLVGVRFDRAELPPAGAELRSSGEMVGQITSAVFSPRLGSALGLAYVRRGSDRAGDQLESAFGAAEVVALPFA